MDRFVLLSLYYVVDSYNVTHAYFVGGPDNPTDDYACGGGRLAVKSYYGTAVTCFECLRYGQDNVPRGISYSDYMDQLLKV